MVTRSKIRTTQGTGVPTVSHTSRDPGSSRSGRGWLSTARSAPYTTFCGPCTDCNQPLVGLREAVDHLVDVHGISVWKVWVRRHTSTTHRECRSAMKWIRATPVAFSTVKGVLRFIWASRGCGVEAQMHSARTPALISDLTALRQRCIQHYQDCSIVLRHHRLSVVVSALWPRQSQPQALVARASLGLPCKSA